MAGAAAAGILEAIGNTRRSLGYHPLGEELWRQSGASVAAFVQSVGTEHSLHGTAHTLRRHNPQLRVAARLAPEVTVATIAVDSGLRYLSTDLYRN